MSEPQDEVIAWLRKNWILPVGVLVVLAVYSLSSWIWTFGAAVVIAWLVIRQIKKHGGPEQAFQKASAAVKKAIDSDVKK